MVIGPGMTAEPRWRIRRRPRWRHPVRHAAAGPAEVFLRLARLALSIMASMALRRASARPTVLSRVMVSTAGNELHGGCGSTTSAGPAARGLRREEARLATQRNPREPAHDLARSRVFVSMFAWLSELPSLRNGATCIFCNSCPSELGHEQTSLHSTSTAALSGHDGQCPYCAS